MIVAVVACLALGPAALPRTAAEAEGAYFQGTGFANYDYRLNAGGRMTLTFHPDHPGGKTWTGTWKFEQGCIHFSLPYRRAGKVAVEHYQLVPVAWGDRLMLVDSEGLLSGKMVARFKEVGRAIGNRKIGDDATDLMVPIRKDSTGSKLPRMYGRPLAPEPFQSLLVGLYLPG